MATVTQNKAAAPTPQQIAFLFLQYAREDFSAIQNASWGTTANSGTLGTWDTPTQDYAAWCTSIDLMCSIPVTITIPAGQGYTISQFAPFTLLQASLLIGGSESIPPISLVPFWLDEITQRGDGYDPAAYGPLNASNQVTIPVSGGTTSANWQNDGSGGYQQGTTTPTSEVLGWNFPVAPGTVYTNSTTASVTQNYTFTFYSRILLARNLFFRKVENLAGAVPMGDPASRPLLNLKLSPTLVGTQPENCFLTNAGAGVTVTGGASTAPFVRAQWTSRTLDQLPPSLQGGIPTPQVLMALEVDTNSGYAIPNAGQFAKLQIRSAMIYHKRFHVVVNDQQPTDPDYSGLWYSDSQANARYAFDAQSNTLQNYYRKVQRTYGRYLPKGVVVQDYIGGDYPLSPRETPYRGLITPSVSLAGLANLKPYPAAQSVVRLASGTTMSNAYATTYDFGLVPVAY